MKEIVAAAVLFSVAGAAFFMSIRSFLEKGFLFNNAYIYACEQEREKMDKKPHYRQSAVVFLLIGLIFLVNGLEMLLKTGWLFYLVIVICVAAAVYAVVSTIAIERKKGSQ